MFARCPLSTAFRTVKCSLRTFRIMTRSDPRDLLQFGSKPFDLRSAVTLPLLNSLGDNVNCGKRCVDIVATRFLELRDEVPHGRLQCACAQEFDLRRLRGVLRCDDGKTDKCRDLRNVERFCQGRHEFLRGGCLLRSGPAIRLKAIRPKIGPLHLSETYPDPWSRPAWTFDGTQNRR